MIAPRHRRRKPALTLAAAALAALSPAFPDSERLLTASFDLRITTWDLETAAPIRALTGKPFGGPGLRFSEDGRRAVWLELDGYIRAADLTALGPNGAPKLLRTFGGSGPEGVPWA